MTEIGTTLRRSDASSFCGVFWKSIGQNAFPVPLKRAKTPGVYYPEYSEFMRFLLLTSPGITCPQGSKIRKRRVVSSRCKSFIMQTAANTGSEVLPRPRPMIFLR